MAKTKPRNLIFEESFNEELRCARREFCRDEVEMLWSALDGNLSESAFVQMLARAGMEQMRKSKAARQRLWLHLPKTARGYRK